MDKASLIGLLLGFGAVIGGMILEGGHLGSIAQPTAAIIVMGGTFGAVFVSFPFEGVMGAFKDVKKIIQEPALNPFEYIDLIINFANKARKEGILSLEKEIKNIEHPFLKKALTMAVDGVEPKIMRDAMETELAYMDEYGKISSKVFQAAGGYAPTVGILGAVLGLIHVMENLSDPSKLGGGIAVAFVATVYGVGTANLLFLPMATKLALRHSEGLVINEMILEGVVALSTGENPRLIEEKLTTYLSEHQQSKNPNKGKEERG